MADESEPKGTSPQDQLTHAIGHIIMMWSNAEAVLGHCLADTLEIDRGKATLLVAGASGRRRIEHLQALIARGVLKLGDDVAAFHLALRELFRLEENRNLAAHSIWISYDDDGELPRAKFTARHDEHNLYYDHADPAVWYEAGQKIGQQLKQLDAIWNRHFPARPSLLKIPGPPSAKDRGGRIPLE